MATGCKEFRPHLAALALALIAVIAGVLLTPGPTGGVLGAIAASVTDPPLLALAGAIGFACCRRTAVLFAFLTLAAILFAWWISIINYDLGARLNGYSILVKIGAFVVVGLSSNAVARALMPRRSLEVNKKPER